MKNFLFGLCATASMMCTSIAMSEELRVGARAVVELFTSQGCSSCPPADAYLDELHKRDKVLALAYHVDYWDYIGWKDTFGSAANSNFQRAYAAARGENRIYTPQMLINGHEDIVGSYRQDVEVALANATMPLQVDLAVSNGMLEVSVGGNANLREAVVWLVTFIDGANIHIERGENRDRDIQYSQIVTSRRVLGMWEPDAGARLKLPITEILGASGNGAALIVQEESNGLPGRILGASSFVR